MFHDIVNVDIVMIHWAWSVLCSHCDMLIYMSVYQTGNGQGLSGEGLPIRPVLSHPIQSEVRVCEYVCVCMCV